MLCNELNRARTSCFSVACMFVYLYTVWSHHQLNLSFSILWLSLSVFCCNSTKKRQNRLLVSSAPTTQISSLYLFRFVGFFLACFLSLLTLCSGWWFSFSAINVTAANTHSSHNRSVLQKITLVVRARRQKRTAKTTVEKRGENSQKSLGTLTKRVREKAKKALTSKNKL